MNTALWVLQGLLALAFFAAGVLKLVTPKDKLAEKMAWVKSSSAQKVKLIGLAELSGAIGLVAPRALGILPVLTPIAALCLVVIMVGAAATHLQLKESPLPPLVIGLMLVCVAVGRFVV